VLLIRQTWRADRTAAVLLVPYADWTAFATALNAEIVRLTQATGSTQTQPRVGASNRAHTAARAADSGARSRSPPLTLTGNVQQSSPRHYVE
jgi:hypothetical protein